MASASHEEGKARRDDLQISMEGGSGETSYARNSQLQRNVVDNVEPVLWDCVARVAAPPAVAPGETALRIADLGCAIGSNTVITIDRAVSHISALLESRSVTVPPQVHAFFNDLPGNDFNTLFRSFPRYTGHGSRAFASAAPADGGTGSGGCSSSGRNYFVAGVPGSFYDRLFPSTSIHAFTCFFALQFIDQVPAEVTDRQSAAFNKGVIWNDRSSLPVRQAFSKQFVRQLTVFLEARAEELVSGGLLIAVMPGVPGEVETEDQHVPRSAFTELMDAAVKELVAEGGLDENAVDMFNMPMRFPCLEEVRSGVQASGAFHIHLLQSKSVHLFPEPVLVALRADAKLCVKMYTGHMRSIFSPTVRSQLGTQATELLFERFAVLLERDHLAYLEAMPLNMQLLVLSKQ